MAGKRSRRIATDGGAADLTQNPFGALGLSGLPEGGPLPAVPVHETVSNEPSPGKDRGRVDVSRQKAGRGGKTVTVATGFKGIASEEKQGLARSIQKACGTGGGLKNGDIEIQGDKREAVKAALEAAGFRVVFVGG